MQQYMGMSFKPLSRLLFLLNPVLPIPRDTPLPEGTNDDK